MCAFTARTIENAHALSRESILELLDVEPEAGLDLEEVERRRSAYGPNTLSSGRRTTVWTLILNQTRSVIVALLVVASAISLARGEVLEALAIAAVLILNAAIGVATEWQANRALEALKAEAGRVCRVRREHREIQTGVDEIVPGDLLILEAGDVIPADARVVEAASVRVVEASLTGESFPVSKSVTPVPEATELADRTSMLHQGTTFASGRAIAVVTATGDSTQLGRIGAMVANIDNEPPPLQKRLDALGRRIVVVVILIAAIFILIGWFRGHPPWSMAETAISLAVAAVPEGLPAVTTLILALGVLRMARRHGVVRRLAAVETLGSTTVICTDKTGTLTTGTMAVIELRLPGGEVVPLDPDLPHSAPRSEQPPADLVLATVLCNDARITTAAAGQTGIEAVGDPTETALLAAAIRLGFDPERLRDRHPRIGEEPFDSSTRRMTTIHTLDATTNLAAMKGAPEAVLAVCTTFRDSEGTEHPLGPDERERINRMNGEMAARALRVLAVASLATRTDTIPDGGFSFLGLVGMLDPPRPEAAAAISGAAEAGLRVIMITGDQAETARSIADNLCIGGGSTRVIHGRELPTDDDLISDLVSRTDVFCRVSPGQKLRIVETLQDRGEIVAVTGDGVNDAPALSRADIGIAMGIRGTDAAKQAADLILSDDNFATIIEAVRGGRTIYSNILKYVRFLFTTNLAEVAVIFWALILDWPLPLLPLQILWINLVTDVFPAFALAMEPSSPDVMRRPPRPPQSEILARGSLFRIAWQAATMSGVTLAAYFWALHEYEDLSHSRTVALITLVGVQIVHSFNSRSRSRSAFVRPFGNHWLWAAAAIMILLQTLAIGVPLLARVLHLSPPRPLDLAVVMIACAAVLVTVEGEKAFRRWWEAGRTRQLHQ